MQQPLLGSQGGGSSGSNWRWWSSPSQGSSFAAAPPPSAYRPPGAEVPQPQDHAPPALGGVLVQAYADVSSTTNTSSKRSAWIDLIQRNIERDVREAAQGCMPTPEREDMYAFLADAQKDQRDDGSSAS